MRKAPNFVDRTGQRYGRLVVIERAGRRRSWATWLCKCDCGNLHVTTSLCLTSGVKSCGCLQKEAAGKRLLTHGHCRRGAETRTNRIWRGLVTRCTNQNSKHWLKYGARGITVCERWRSYENFLADMGEAPDGLSIERIDNAGPYSPENCRWATVLEQANNTRRSRLLTVNGRTQSLAQWAREGGRNQQTISYRLEKGWTPERAVFEPGTRGDNQFGKKQVA